MPLSISNSNNRLPTGSWFLVWGLVGFFYLATVGFIEIRLRSNGLKPSLADSKNLWATHREKASQLGSNAFIVIGASRAQLGIDLQTIKDETVNEPVQLAINASQLMPVLKNLAEDNRITGTVLISLSAANVYPIQNPSNDKASEWVKYYENISWLKGEPYKIINEKIKSFMDSNLASRFEGARPVTLIKKSNREKIQYLRYLTTNKDRSRDADYKKIPTNINNYYFARLVKHIGLKPDLLNFTHFYIQQVAINTIKKTEPLNLDNFDEGLEILTNYVRSIESRGGKVIIIRMPTDKLIWEFDKRKYPKELYWNRIKESFENVIHFSDYSSLSKYDLPDGSHLDFRDKKAFTYSLIEIINENFN